MIIIVGELSNLVSDIFTKFYRQPLETRYNTARYHKIREHFKCVIQSEHIFSD